MGLRRRGVLAATGAAAVVRVVPPVARPLVPDFNAGLRQGARDDARC